MVTYTSWTYAGPKSEYFDRYIDWIDRGKGVAILHKKANSKVIKSAEEWHPDARLTNVLPVPGNRYKPSGTSRTVPRQHNVVRPSVDEIRALLYNKELIGSLENATILDGSDFSGFTDITGAIPVVDSSGTLSEGLLYYLPAVLIPTSKVMAEKFDLLDPHYLSLKTGEMPSFVFWLPKSGWGAQRPTDARTARTANPSPEAVAGPSRETLQVDTKKAEGEKEPKYTVEVFNPEAEEDPIQFLEVYNDSTKGYNAIRSRMMLREEDIERVHFDTPCLRHPTKEQLQKMPKISEPRKKLPEIAEDDPSFLNFKKKLQGREDNRTAKISPPPVFTPEYCNHTHLNGPKDPLKADLTRDLYLEYWRRAKQAEAEIEKRSTCCRACGLAWKKTKESQHAHYERHRQEYTLWLELEKPGSARLQPPVRAKTLAPPSEGVPSLASFRTLEKIIEGKENELLQRAQVCRICDEVLDYAFQDPQEHYAQHADQRDAIRSVDPGSKHNNQNKHALSDLVAEAVEDVVEEVLKSASTDTSLPTPESKTFEPLREKHPLVVRAEEALKKKEAFTSRFRFQSRSRSRSTSRPAEGSRQPAERRRSLSSPFVSPRTAETPKSCITHGEESTKTSPTAKKVRIESKPTLTAESNLFYDAATGEFRFLGAAKAKKISNAKKAAVAPGVQKLSNLLSFPKSGGVTSGLFEPVAVEEVIEISSDEASAEYESEDKAKSDALVRAIQKNYEAFLKSVAEGSGDESEEVTEESDEEEESEVSGSELPPQVIEISSDAEPDSYEEVEEEEQDGIEEEAEEEEAEEEEEEEEEVVVVPDEMEIDAGPEDEAEDEPDTEPAGPPTSRPTPAKRGRKRKASDAPYIDIPDTLLSDERSPVLRAPKMPRKAKDPAYTPAAEETPSPPSLKQKKKQAKKSKQATPAPETAPRRPSQGPPAPITLSSSERPAGPSSKTLRQKKRQAKRAARKAAMKAIEAAMAKEASPAPVEAKKAVASKTPAPVEETEKGVAAAEKIPAVAAAKKTPALAAAKKTPAVAAAKKTPVIATREAPVAAAKEAPDAATKAKKTKVTQAAVPTEKAHKIVKAKAVPRAKAAAAAIPRSKAAAAPKPERKERPKRAAAQGPKIYKT